MHIHARLIHNPTLWVKRLMRNTMNWSTLALAGNASAWKVEGALSIGFDHHQPWSIVLFVCMRTTRLSLEKTRGT
jgi:hypothetical protein